MLLKSKKNIGIIIVFVICMFVSKAVFDHTKQPLSYYQSQDIHSHWQASKDILNGKNPYIPILNSDMEKNNKYPTYLAGFYYLIAPTVKNYKNFNDWIEMWKIVSVIFYGLVGFLIFYNSHKNSKTFPGLLLAGIWFFNRWSIYLAITLSMDTIPIFLLLLSLTIINTYPKKSLVIFGTQLALKHLTIFLLPLFIIKTAKKGTVENIKNLLLIIVPMLIVSIVFLIKSPSAYLKSVLFTGTRLAETHFTVTSLTVGEIFKVEGLNERLPILFFVSIVYYLLATKRISFIVSVILIMLISITFNPIFFLQYQAWFIGVLLFWIGESTRE